MLATPIANKANKNKNGSFFFIVLYLTHIANYINKEILFLVRNEKMPSFGHFNYFINNLIK